MISFNSPLGKNFCRVLSFYFITFLSFFSVQELRAEIPASKPLPQERAAQTFNPIFRPGDAVQISVYPDTSSFLHNVFPIDGKGFIFLPVVGKTQVVAMNETEFINFLSKNFTQYLRTPTIQVRILIRASALVVVSDPVYFMWIPIHLCGIWCIEPEVPSGKMD